MATNSFERELWTRYETIHAVTYFAAHATAAATAAGTHGFWMGYFGCRAAPMGAVTPGVVEATFFNFAPSMVRRAVPDAWTFSSPAALLVARSSSAATVLRDASPGLERQAVAALTALRPVLTGDGSGRALYAANRDLPEPADPVEALWQATTTLREHRGDGHVAALLANDIDGCEAHLLIAADGGTPGERLRTSRGWTEDDWAAADLRLRSRGLLATDGPTGQRRLTTAGAELRARVERATDVAAGRLTGRLDDDARVRLIDLLDPIARDVVRAGVLTFPNPIGLTALGGDPDVVV